MYNSRIQINIFQFEAETIESLVRNGYVERDGKKLHATDKGSTNVELIDNIREMIADE